MTRISFIGSRGIPAKYGGFETFVEEVCAGLKKKGYEIVVVGDDEQKRLIGKIDEYNGINIMYSRFKKAKNPILFYLDSMIIAIKNTDLIYSCGTGAGYFSFLPLLFNKTFVTNPDGMGWHRDKWSLLVKLFLKSMFYCTAKWSEYLIYDSKGIESVFKKEFNREKNSIVIEYGAYINKYLGIENETIKKVLLKYNLIKDKYHLVVSRLEPENNVEVIIRGYNLSCKKYPLIIVGNIQDTSYVQTLKAFEGKNIRFIGGIYKKEELEIVRANAYSYLHGHSVGGTNPSLLESMASSNYCICHDNVFNREVVLDNGRYFSNEQDVCSSINFIEDSQNIEEYNACKAGGLKRIADYYSWDKIVNKYSEYINLIMLKK